MLSNFTAVRHAGQELQKPLYKLSKLRKQNSCRQEGKRYGPAIPQREKKQWRQFCTFDVVVPQMEEKQWRSRFLLVVLVIVHVMENSPFGFPSPPRVPGSPPFEFPSPPFHRPSPPTRLVGGLPAVLLASSSLQALNRVILDKTHTR